MYDNVTTIPWRWFPVRFPGRGRASKRRGVMPRPAGGFPMVDRAGRFASRTGPLADLTSRERLVLRTVRARGTVSRAELIEATGLPGVAVFRATNDLAGRGLLEIGDTVLQKRGKPSNAVRLRAGAIAVLGVSVMADHAEAVLMDFTGTIRAAAPVGVPGLHRGEVAGRIERFLDTQLNGSGLKRRGLIGAGLAVAGSLPGAPKEWTLPDLPGAMQQALGLPFAVETIAHAAAVGEQLLGAGQRFESFVYLDIGHGFGAGLIDRGRLLRGRSGKAGEMQAVLAAAGLPAPTLGSLRADLEADGVRFRDAGHLVAELDPSLPAVERWIDRHAPSVSFAANAAQALFDSDAVVLGGLLPSALAERLIGRIRWPDEERALRPRLLKADVTRHAAATGAAATLLAQAFLDG